MDDTDLVKRAQASLMTLGFADISRYTYSVVDGQVHATVGVGSLGSTVKMVFREKLHWHATEYATIGGIATTLYNYHVHNKAGLEAYLVSLGGLR